MSRRGGKQQNVDLEFDLSISSLIVSCNGFLEIIHQYDTMKLSTSLWLRPKLRHRCNSTEHGSWVNVWKAGDPLNKHKYSGLSGLTLGDSGRQNGHCCHSVSRV